MNGARSAPYNPNTQGAFYAPGKVIREKKNGHGTTRKDTEKQIIASTQDAVSLRTASKMYLVSLILLQTSQDDSIT